jgi:agmatinase
VLHFDSHLDSWDPKQLGGGHSKYSEITHGSMFHILHEEGLLSEHKNMHLGSRSMLFDQHYDLDNDANCGFSYIRAREMDHIGVDAVVDRIVNKVGAENVYLSIDIDVMDPGKSYGIVDREPIGSHTDNSVQHLHPRQERLNQVAGLAARCSESSMGCQKQA